MTFMWIKEAADERATGDLTGVSEPRHAGLRRDAQRAVDAHDRVSVMRWERKTPLPSRPKNLGQPLSPSAVLASTSVSFWHLTPAVNLPGILEAGGLLSPRSLMGRGAVPTRLFSWNGLPVEAAVRGCVSLAIGHRFILAVAAQALATLTPLALLRVPTSVADVEGARFLPGWPVADDVGRAGFVGAPGSQGVHWAMGGRTTPLGGATAFVPRTVYVEEVEEVRLLALRPEVLAKVPSLPWPARVEQSRAVASEGRWTFLR